MATESIVAGSQSMSFKRLVEDYERELIRTALDAAGGNQRRAARALGVLATTLNEKMKRLGMRPADVVRHPDPFPSALTLAD